jgi:hypothetical protein
VVARRRILHSYSPDVSPREPGPALWYKNAVFYELHAKVYDSKGGLQRCAPAAGQRVELYQLRRRLVLNVLDHSLEKLDMNVSVLTKL